MLLVKRSDGQPWFYIDARPTSAASFREVFRTYDPAAKPDAPVTRVTYDEARSFATTRGGRLPTAEEWIAAATRVPGFTAAAGLHEWVDSPGETKTTLTRDVSTLRPEGKHADVTFRTARDP